MADDWGKAAKFLEIIRPILSDDAIIVMDHPEWSTRELMVLLDCSQPTAFRRRSEVYICVKNALECAIFGGYDAET